MADTRYFPMFVDISRRRVLVVGAGRIAARRVATLLSFCGDIRVVAPEACAQIGALAAAGEVRLCLRAYAAEDLLEADIVLACTDDPALNAAVAAGCRERGVPVNVCSDRTLCDFYFPGVVIQGDVVAGVTAGGRDHALAREATARVRRCLAGEGEDRA